MRKIMYAVLYIMYRGDRAKVLSAMCLWYYKQMKHREEYFKEYRSALLNVVFAPYQTNTVFGKVRVSQQQKAILNMPALIQYIPVNKLMDMSAVRVNLVMKYLGNEFDKVVEKWYNSKSVLFDIDK